MKESAQNEQQSSPAVQTINTTLGDLVAVITEVALEAGRTEEEGYRLASLALENILRRRRPTSSQSTLM